MLGVAPEVPSWRLEMSRRLFMMMQQLQEMPTMKEPMAEMADIQTVDNDGSVPGEIITTM